MTGTGEAVVRPVTFHANSCGYLVTFFGRCLFMADQAATLILPGLHTVLHIPAGTVPRGLDPVALHTISVVAGVRRDLVA